MNTPLDAFKDLNCCWLSRCHPLAVKAIKIVMFLPTGKYRVGIKSVKWTHLLCLPRGNLRWSTRIWNNSTDFWSFRQYPSQENLASTSCSTLLHGCRVQQRRLKKELVEEKEGYEVVPCQNPQSLQKLQLGVQGKVHGLRWDAELGCGGDHIWERQKPYLQY